MLGDQQQEYYSPPVVSLTCTLVILRSFVALVNNNNKSCAAQPHFYVTSATIVLANDRATNTKSVEKYNVLHVCNRNYGTPCQKLYKNPLMVVLKKDSKVLFYE